MAIPPEMEDTMSYGEALDYIAVNEGIFVKQLEWPAGRYIYVDRTVVYIHTEAEETMAYQEWPSYNLSSDIYKQWQIIE